MHPQKKTSHLSLINANYLQIIITFAHHFKITLMESKISYKVIYNTLKDQIHQRSISSGVYVAYGTDARSKIFCFQANHR